MRGNSFGKLLTMSTFGESHGQGLGVVLDGIPAGLDFDSQKLRMWLERRRPGKTAGASERQELDQFEILSGIYQEKTLGTPIALLVRNYDAKSSDYSFLQTENRLGHADETTLLKFGYRDPRGGGRASGRETVARVIGGYFASLILPRLEIKIQTLEMGELSSFWVKDHKDFGIYGFPSFDENEKAKEYLSDLRVKGESVGCRLAVDIRHCPSALGEPVFDKLKAELAHALLSIGGCMGLSFGAGNNFSTLKGSEINQRHLGGIVGGISNGEDIYLELLFKPPSTVGEKAKQGRHDACLAPRVFVVVEAMIHFVLADQLLRQNAFQLN
jgi:chorismate synthase